MTAESGSGTDRRRLIAVVSVLAAHVAAYAGLSVAGLFNPFEIFNLLLLCANVVAAVAIVRGKRDALLGAGVMILVGSHAFIGNKLAPDALTSGALLMVNLLVLYVGLKINEHLPRLHWYLFLIGYFTLFGIFVIAMRNAEPLFLLFLMGLAATARSVRLTAYFWALTLSFTFCQPYAWEALIISYFFLTAWFGLRGEIPSRAAKLFFSVGFILVMLVLLPVVMIVTGEDLRSMQSILSDPRIRSAIALTAITATVSTLILALFCIPFAYALSRLRFPGRSLLLALTDLPIVIPQSAAGIAILTVFGQRQFLGETVFSLFGVTVDGTVLGIIVAQVFVAMPFLLKSALAGFDAVPPELEEVARTLRASSWDSFRRVALPLASKGVFAGLVLAWARAAGEFGAVVIIAPSPETAPVTAFNRFNSVGLAETGPLVAVLILFSVAMFLLLQLVSRALPALHDRGTQ